jgi:hypothetical protein
MSFGVGDPTAPYPRRQKSVEVLIAVVRHVKEQLQQLLAFRVIWAALISKTPSAQAGSSAHVPRQAKGEKTWHLPVLGDLRSVRTMSSNNCS